MKHNRLELALAVVCAVCVGAQIIVAAAGAESALTWFLALVLIPFVYMAGATSYVQRRRAGRPAAGRLVIPAVAMALLLSVALTDWPLRAAYGVSRGSMNALARRLRRGEPLQTPVQAGLFRIRRAELSRDGVVCLWTFPDSGGNTGFVQCDGVNVPFNLWSIVNLDDQWQFIAED